MKTPACIALPEQGARLLQLQPFQRMLLRVDEGRLWLTEDGRLEDRVLDAGERLELFGPARYRLGAFGPGAAVVTASEFGYGSPSASPKWRTAAPAGAA